MDGRNQICMILLQFSISSWEQSQFHGIRTLVNDWDRPERVELVYVEGPKVSGPGALPYLLSRIGPDAELHIFGNEADQHKATKVKPIPELLEKFLALAEASDEAIRRFASKYGGIEIFKKQHGGSIEYCGVWRYFARAMHSVLALSSLPGDTSKARRDLRHTAATLLAVQVVHAKTIQAVLGWDQASMMDRYTHFVDEMRQEAAKQMDAILKPVAVSVAVKQPVRQPS